MVFYGYIKFIRYTFQKMILDTFDSANTLFSVCTVYSVHHIIETCFNIDLTNVLYSSMNDHRFLNSSEWRFINPKTFKGFLIVLSIC